MIVVYTKKKAERYLANLPCRNLCCHSENVSLKLLEVARSEVLCLYPISLSILETVKENRNAFRT